MKHFYIIVNAGKDDAVDMKLNISEYLESRGATCKTSSGEFSKGCPFTFIGDVPPETECIITLGGDGTRSVQPESWQEAGFRSSVSTWERLAI